MLVGQALHLVVVDGAGLAGHAVEDDVVEPAREVDRGAVGQVTAMGEVHAEHGIAGLQRAEVDGHVGLGAGMGLDVGVLRSEEPLGALDGQVLGQVHEFAAAVVALAGIAFGVLVGQHAAHGLAHGRGGEVFGGDEFQAAHLAVALQGYGSGQFRILHEEFFHGLPSC